LGKEDERRTTARLVVGLICNRGQCQNFCARLEKLAA